MAARDRAGSDGFVELTSLRRRVEPEVMTAESTIRTCTVQEATNITLLTTLLQ